MLDKFEVAYERHVISAHRMPSELQKFGEQAQKDVMG